MESFSASQRDREREEEEVDLDWEDADDYTDVGTGDIDIDISTEPADLHDIAFENQPKKRKREDKSPGLRWDKHDSLRSTTLHWDHIDRAVVAGRAAALVSKSNVLQTAIISRLPPELESHKNNTELTLETVQALHGWIRKNFREISEPGESDSLEPSAPVHEAAMNKVLEQRAGTRRQLSILLMCLFQGLEKESRLVCAIDPPSWKVQNHWSLYEAAWVRGQNECRRSAARTPSSTPGEGQTSNVCKDLTDIKAIHQKWLKSHPEVFQKPTLHWVEVYIASPPVSKNSAYGAMQHVNAPRDRLSATGTQNDPVCLDEDVGQQAASNTSLPAPLASTMIAANSINGGGRWIHVDPCGVIDAPLQVELDLRSISGRPRYVQYVCSIDSFGHCVDVTRRYASRLDKTALFTSPVLQKRWTELLQLSETYDSPERHTNFSTSNAVESRVQNSSIKSVHTSEVVASEQLGSSTAAASTSALKLTSSVQISEKKISQKYEEDQQLRRALGPKPTTLAGFKTHPDYVLNCPGYLKATEVLQPGTKALGLFKGYAIYKRADVVTALTRKQWRQNLRDILPDCLDSPVLVQNRADGRGKSRGEAEQYEIKLYGPWQTKPLVVLPVVNDIIPTNSYGNVEIWEYQESLVPPGAKLISGKQYNTTIARRVCKELSISFVDAIVGFERGEAGPLPVVGGIVVLERDYEVITGAAGVIMEQNREHAVLKKSKLIIARWESLIKHALIRLELKARYGH